MTLLHNDLPNNHNFLTNFIYSMFILHCGQIGTHTGTQVNFDKQSSITTTTYGVEYDYGSVMHYSPGAFSRNGLPTITPKVSMVHPKQMHYLVPIYFYLLNQVSFFAFNAECNSIIVTNDNTNNIYFAHSHAHLTMS